MKSLQMTLLLCVMVVANGAAVAQPGGRNGPGAGPMGAGPATDPAPHRPDRVGR